MKSLGNRVFSKPLFKTQSAIPGGAADYEELAADTWQAEEDVTIIGLILRVSMELINANDGPLYFQGQISQSPLFDKEGVVASVSGFWDWNTAPAFGIHNQREVSIMFPEGKGMPLREGNNLNLHMSWRVGYTSGTTSFVAKSEVFYVKGLPAGE